MKHVYPPRHPAWLDEEPDAAPQPGDHAGVADGSAKTDSELARDKVRDGKAAPPRGADEPRR